ncbi:hypothetical protein DVS28_a2866 [Euzebya pacifica]|uniref:S-layer family protein n=1 Tax=Euzebya pacifica TaxID=1608957 RepID=A0A346XZ98_9ACTN|nr:hypothetical protein [Euzebya pacifica]AXV07545.1 hypothetical protein DVS28_a2866 [Euzebya pacifica]
MIDSLDVSVDGTALQASHLTSLVVDNNTAAQERLHSGGDQAIDLFDVPSLALTTDSVSSSNASAPGIDITSTGGSFTVEGTTTVTNNAATAVDIDSGPTTTFGGLVQASGVGGLQLTGGATTLSALGGLQATGTSGMGLDVGNGTTINVAGVGSTASSGTNTAVNILGTIGGVGVTFDSVSTNGGTDGIVLANTGAGAFTVTGGTGNDGGTIQGVSNDGISLTNVGGLVSLDDMTISSTGRHGIRGQDVAGGFEAVRPTLSSIGNADDERGIWLTDPGAVTITDPDLSTIADTAIEVDRTVSTATGEVSITATTPGPHIRTTSAPFSGAGIELTAIGSGAAIAGGRIDGIGMTGIDGPAVRIIADGPLANPASIGTQGSVGSDSTGSFVVNDVTVGSVAPFVGGAAGGIQVTGLDDATMDVDVRNVTVVSENAFAFSTIARDDADVVVELVDSTLAIANPAFGLAAVNAALAGNAGQAPVLHATLRDNIIGVDGQADGAGSVGIAIGGSDSAGTLDAVLTGNEVINPSVSAVRVDRGKAADHIRGTITQTVVSTPQTTPEGGMDIFSTNGSGGAIDLVITDSSLVGRLHGLLAVIDDGAAGCLDVGTNTLTATDLTLGTGADVTVSGGSTLSFPGFSGGDASAYLIGRNTFIDPAPTVSGGPDGSTCATTRIR